VPTEGEGFDRLLRWFRQRRLLQVLAIYLGASWLILEITDVFIDKLALPAWPSSCCSSGSRLWSPRRSSRALLSSLQKPKRAPRS
jgi:hypothetical protein